MSRRRHGIIYLKQDGNLLQAEGEFTYNFGTPKREPRFGSGGKVVGTSETPQEPYIKGEIVLEADTDAKAITNIRQATITLEMDQKTLVLRNAEYYADGEAKTSDGHLQVEFFGDELEEI